MNEDFRRFLKEAKDFKEQRAQAIEISSDKKLNKSESYKFNFKFMEYKLDKGDYPIHPSGSLKSEFQLEITSTKGSLETIFNYNYSIVDYLDSKGTSRVRFENPELIDFQCFINDEEVKLDKSTANKISKNLKPNEKAIKAEFTKQFDLLKDTNYSKIKDEIDEIMRINKEYAVLQDMMDKSDKISKIVKKYNAPIQKIVYYRDILVLFNGYLNEKMRKETKHLLDSYDTEVHGINDTNKRRAAEETNSEVLSGLKKVGSGKLIYISRGNEVIMQF